MRKRGDDEQMAILTPRPRRATNVACACLLPSSPQGVGCSSAKRLYQALPQRGVAGDAALPGLVVVDAGPVVDVTQLEPLTAQILDATPVVVALGERKHPVHVEQRRLDHFRSFRETTRRRGRGGRARRRERGTLRRVLHEPEGGEDNA